MLFNSDAAQRIKSAVAILWDEVTMSPYYAVDAVDKFLQELIHNSFPFGGKVVVFSSDWMQYASCGTRYKNDDTRTDG